MILIIDTNSKEDSLHYLEFVKPITEILESNNSEHNIIHYKKLDTININNYDKIIICGTALKNNDYLDNIQYFEILLSYTKPILGICSGSQIVGKIFANACIESQTEIGFYELEILEDERIVKNINHKIYCLHNFYTEENKDIDVIARTNIPQIFKTKTNKYGVLFHPEVRQEKIIINFINLIE